jgi:hypothetical protein
MPATEVKMNRERVHSLGNLFHAVVFCPRTSRKPVSASDEVEPPWKLYPVLRRQLNLFFLLSRSRIRIPVV